MGLDAFKKIPKVLPSIKDEKVKYLLCTYKLKDKSTVKHGTRVGWSNLVMVFYIKILALAFWNGGENRVPVPKENSQSFESKPDKLSQTRPNGMRI